ncbi:hypothetical protein HDK77DRAFT_510946 [Phyllosticta capitalensis]
MPATPSNFDSNHWYQILTQNTTLAISGTACWEGLYFGSAYPEFSNRSDPSQQWQIYPYNSSFYVLRTRASGPDNYLRTMAVENTADPYPITETRMANSSVQDSSMFWAMGQWADGPYYLWNAENGSDWHLNTTLVVEGHTEMLALNPQPEQGQAFSFKQLGEINDNAFSSITPPSEISSSITMRLAVRATTTTGALGDGYGITEESSSTTKALSSSIASAVTVTAATSSALSSLSSIASVTEATSSAKTAYENISSAVTVTDAKSSATQTASDITTMLTDSPTKTRTGSSALSSLLNQSISQTSTGAALQRLTFTPPGTNAKSSTTKTRGSNSSPTKSTDQDSFEGQRKSTSGADSGLSTGVKAAIGIGAAIIVLLLFALALFLMRRHRRRRQNKVALEVLKVHPQDFEQPVPSEMAASESFHHTGPAELPAHSKPLEIDGVARVEMGDGRERPIYG